MTRPTALLLGCGHWANTKLDRINFFYGDMLAPARQQEIEAFASRLARFRPTKVAVELDAKDDAAINDE